MISTRKYASCSFCGASVEEQHIHTDLRIGDQLVVFENVPVGVCTQCGEEYFRGDVHDKMLALAKEPTKKKIQVPVHAFTDALTAAAARARKKQERSEHTRDEEVHLATEEEIRELTELEEPPSWDEEDR